jgi:hypothetical protein
VGGVVACEDEETRTPRAKIYGLPYPWYTWGRQFTKYDIFTGTKHFTIQLLLGVYALPTAKYAHISFGGCYSLQLDAVLNLNTPGIPIGQPQGSPGQSTTAH